MSGAFTVTNTCNSVTIKNLMKIVKYLGCPAKFTPLPPVMLYVTDDIKIA